MKSMKNIKFKHTRSNILQAMFGDLSEDASYIAAEETSKRIHHFFKNEFRKYMEEENNEGYVSSTRIFEMIINHFSSPQEIVYALFNYGRLNERNDYEAERHEAMIKIMGRFGGRGRSDDE